MQPENIQYIRTPVTHQVRSNTSTNTEPDVNVDGVTAVLSDLSESRQRSRNGKGKHQDGFQQLGAIRDGWIKVHLEERRATKVSEYITQIYNTSPCSFWQPDKRKAEAAATYLQLVDPAKYRDMWSTYL